MRHRVTNIGSYCSRLTRDTPIYSPPVMNAAERFRTRIGGADPHRRNRGTRGSDTDDQLFYNLVQGGLDQIDGHAKPDLLAYVHQPHNDEPGLFLRRPGLDVLSAARPTRSSTDSTVPCAAERTKAPSRSTTRWSFCAPSACSPTAITSSAVRRASSTRVPSAWSGPALTPSRNDLQPVRQRNTRRLAGPAPGRGTRHHGHIGGRHPR